jgi:hypothetical protein
MLGVVPRKERIMLPGVDFNANTRGRKTLRPCGRSWPCVGRAVRIFDRLAAGYVRTQPAGVEGYRRLGSQKSVRINLQCPLLFPFAVTSRRSRDVRINQRIDSLPCPALFSMFPGRLARFRGRGFHQTTTIGLRRLELRLDYAGAGGMWSGGGVRSN